MARRIEKIPAKYRKDVEKELARLASLIKSRRKELKLTQEAVAEELDVSPVSIQHIEQGRRQPSVTMLFALLKLLKISLDYK